jgi:FkbM family methyltransferase
MKRVISIVINRLTQLIQYARFKLKYPNVPIVKPLKLGTFFSQDGQDFYLSSLLFNYLLNHKNSWVIDVGCNHPQNFSNSLFFEKAFNCRTLAIDPIVEFSEIWANHRPSAIFLNAAIGSSSDQVVLRVPTGRNADNMFASVEGGTLKKKWVDHFIERSITCLKLSDVFILHNISEAILLSIDVEGFEMEVLKSIDFSQCLIRCIVLENNSQGLYGSDDVRDFLGNHGFVFHSRIGWLDDVFVHSSMINGRYI